MRYSLTTFLSYKTLRACHHLSPEPPASFNENANYPRFIQKLYKRNRRRAVRTILNDAAPPCSLSAETLAAAFFPHEVAHPNFDLFQHPAPASDEVDLHPFSPEEIWSKLKSAESTAPRLDRLTYFHWKSVDPEAKCLAAIFNICSKLKSVPDDWKASKTIFIPKKGGGPSPSDWRPIALGSTIAKLFCSCLARRFSAWYENFSILFPAQKGFLPFDGCFENNFAVNKRLQDATATGKDICFLSLDLSNAFGSVSHNAIIEALRSAGAGDCFSNLVLSLYSGSSTSLIWENGLSDPVAIHAGVKQGCPLSGLLFNLAVDPLLRNLRSECGTNILAYADDINLIVNSPSELQDLANRAAFACDLLGLRINPLSASLYI